MNSAIVDFVTEEVWRQGHDVKRPDGLIRVSWMLAAYSKAMEWEGKLTVDKIITLGQMIERVKNEGGVRTVNVWVGNRACPHPSELNRKLKDFVKWQHHVPPMDAYKHFETIHPFVDGNGRTGKIILNYLNESMDHPIFPPHDLWGYPIRNP